MLIKIVYVLMLSVSTYELWPETGLIEADQQQLTSCLQSQANGLSTMWPETSLSASQLQSLLMGGETLSETEATLCHEMKLAQLLAYIVFFCRETAATRWQ